MRLLAAAALAVLLTGLAGCGPDDPAGAPDPTGSSPAGSGSAGGGPAEVALLSEPVAGGESSPVATRLDGARDVATLTRGLGGRLAEKVADAVAGADVPPGAALYGAVVAVGCDVPAGVSVSRDGARVLVTARTVKTSPAPQCLAPITTVAVVSVPER